MKKLIAVVLIVFVIVFAVYAEGMNGMKCKGMKDGSMIMGECKMMDMASCPFCVKGAEVKVENTADGIKITVVSKDKAAVKEIQEKGAKFTASCAAMGAKGEAAANPAVTLSKMDGNPDDMVTCPVTGETLKKKDAYSVYEYKGKKYYMCCNMCPKLFTTNPEKYVK